MAPQCLTLLFFSFLKFIPLTKSLCGSLGDSIRHYGSRRKTVTMPSQLWPQVENHFVFNISGDVFASRCFKNSFQLSFSFIFFLQVLYLINIYYSFKIFFYYLYTGLFYCLCMIILLSEILEYLSQWFIFSVTLNLGGLFCGMFCILDYKLKFGEVLPERILCKPGVQCDLLRGFVLASLGTSI